MKETIQAACGSHVGKLRRKNEDNFFFDGKCLERDNCGLKNPAYMEARLTSGTCFAIFDGMGGERFGEFASYAAARQMQQMEKSFSDFLIPEKTYLKRLANNLNKAVNCAQNEMGTDRMGTTMVSLHFFGRYAYICNVGDSRAYRLRNGEFLQLSVDHTVKRPQENHRKAPLMQYLGYGTEAVQIDPYIAKGEVQKNDIYLLCSDGLTDMLTNFEISDILFNQKIPETCVRALLEAALAHGGRDNITAIVCRII